MGQTVTYETISKDARGSVISEGGKDDEGRRAVHREIANYERLRRNVIRKDLSMDK